MAITKYRFPRLLIYTFVLLLYGCVTVSNHSGSLESSAALESSAGDEALSLMIMHLNDTHSHVEPTKQKLSLASGDEPIIADVGSLARVSTKIRELRAANTNTLTLHGGDMVQGTLYYMKYEGASDAALYNHIGLDAMVPGNHEFDRGSEAFARLLGRMQFPVVSANIEFKDEPALSGSHIAPHVIKQYNGQRVAIIGLTFEGTSEISNPGKNVRFTSVTKAAQDQIDALSAEGVNKFILLTHIGMGKDIELAHTLRGVDVIVGGHSHTLTGQKFKEIGLTPADDYPIVTKDASGNTALIVQAWQWQSVLGVLTVHFDKGGNVYAYKGSPVILTGEPFHDAKKNIIDGEKLSIVKEAIARSGVVEIVDEDPQLVALANGYKEALDAYKSEIVATAKVDFKQKSTPGGDESQYLIGPVVCESVLWKTKSVGLGVKIALQNAGGIRADINSGPVSAADIYTLLPFANTIVVLDLTGAELKKTLEESIDFALTNRYGSSLTYVAGFRYRVKEDNPKGSRITMMEVEEENGWLPIDMNATIKVAVNSYMASGKDGYDTLAAITNKQDTGFVDAELFIEYAKAKGELVPVKDQRIM